MVVGAGVAGATVASRLVARGASVLVLESGLDDPMPRSAWPDPASGATVPVDGAPSAGRYPVGRGPGGGSRVNGLVLSMGMAGDYDGWNGCWEGVRGRFDSLGVPVDAASEAEWSAVDAALASRLSSLGAGRDDEWWRNGGSGTWGVATYAWSRAARTSVWHGLAAAAPLRAGAHVARVVVTGGHATSVVLRDGTEIRTGDVVLCAGAAATPSLLGASGVAVFGAAHDHPAVAIAVRPARPSAPSVHCGVTGRLAVRAPGDLLVSSWTSADGADGAVLVAAATGPAGSVGADGRLAVEVGEAHLEVLDAGVRVALGAVSAGIASGDLLDAPCDGWATSIDALRTAPPSERREWIRSRISGHWHLAGTASGTVDAHGAVRGTTGLWVADAAAMPSLPRSGPMASVMAMAAGVAESVGGRD